MSVSLDMIMELAKKYNQIENTEYFKNLAENNIKPINFILDQYNFSVAINYWSKILGYLLSLLNNPDDRLSVLKNLYDESGNLGMHDDHITTFSHFIDSFQPVYDTNVFSEEIIKKNAATKPVVNFVAKIQELTYGHSSHDIIYICATLGMIEYTYITVSKIIHNYAKHVLNTEDITHYSMHEILDVSHSTDLFKIITNLKIGFESNIPNEQKFMSIVEKGIKNGYDMLNDYYNSNSGSIHIGV